MITTRTPGTPPRLRGRLSGTDGDRRSAGGMQGEVPSGVIDPRIDVHAQYALQRMSQGDPGARADGAGMLAAVKSGALAGIYKEDQAVPARRAQRTGRGWWQLIPQGADAALMPDPAEAPLIVFRDGVRSNPARLDPALRRAFAQFRGGGGGPPLRPPPTSGRALAVLDKPLALSWARQGLLAARHLHALVSGAPGVQPEPRTARFVQALETHFKILGVSALVGAPPSAAKARVINQLRHVRDSYQLIVTLMTAPSADNRLRDAVPGFDRVFAISADTPAFSFFNGPIFFTPAFRPSDPPGATPRRGFGAPARSAMVLHEYVHVVDAQSGRPENHVSEFDPAYARMTADQSIHNASSYAAFGQHACYGVDTSFGAGAAVRHVAAPPAPSCL